MAGGAVLLGAGFWFWRRLLRDWTPEEETRSPAGSARLERREISAPSDPPSTLRHTRRVIHQQLRLAARRAHAARPGETVREWARRVYGPAALSAVALYEEVRYGSAVDSAERAAAARHWPSSPREPPPTSK